MFYLILQEDDGMFAAGMSPEATVYVEESYFGQKTSHLECDSKLLVIDPRRTARVSHYTCIWANDIGCSGAAPDEEP